MSKQTLEELLQANHGPSPMHAIVHYLSAYQNIWECQEAYFNRVAQERVQGRRVLFGLDVEVSPAIPDDVIVLKAGDDVRVIKIGENKDGK